MSLLVAAATAVGLHTTLAGATTVPRRAATPALVTSGFIDYEVGDKHHRHDLTSFSLPSAYYTRVGDSEEFGLRTGASNRVEHDTDVHYRSGVRQFDGDLQVFPGISRQSVVQIFGGGRGGPILMIKAYGRNNGSLVVTRDTSHNLITDAFGAGPIHVRLVHDVDAHRLTISINGVQKWSGPDGGPSYTGGYNIKYGLYGTFSAPTHTIWSGVTMS
jgi:hypothetical protein